MEEQEPSHLIVLKASRRDVKKRRLLDGAFYKQAAQRLMQSKQRYIHSKITPSLTQVQALASQVMEILNLMQASWRGIHFRSEPSHASNSSKIPSHLPAKY